MHALKKAKQKPEPKIVITTHHNIYNK